MEYCNSDINLLLCEILESHGYRHFEKGRFDFGEKRFVLFHEMDHVFFRDHLPVYFDTFPEIFQMRGRVQSGFIPGFL